MCIQHGHCDRTVARQLLDNLKGNVIQFLFFSSIHIGYFVVLIIDPESIFKALL